MNVHLGQAMAANDPFILSASFISCSSVLSTAFFLVSTDLQRSTRPVKGASASETDVGLQKTVGFPLGINELVPFSIDLREKKQV
ncbi:hypothetical protein EYF80_037288 [Liparis tanakae]|uniref:Uncharacterized protein n=1 Tax=Liparis tanakae TaxID=230148 RepID=A0A4Z2GH11_9TELE|nr:hypothetical protein EYF80_037288 [Liparis tanakae]